MNDEDNVQASLAGQILSSWLPVGLIRKLLFFMLLILAAIGIATGPQLYHFLFIMIASIMSPRVVGVISFYLGRFVAIISNKNPK
jgi:hypothetical protein